MHLNSVLDVKVLVGAVNQEKVTVWDFSVIVKTNCETDGSFYSTNFYAGFERIGNIGIAELLGLDFRIQLQIFD